MPELHPDRLFPAEAGARGMARRLFAEVAGLPIVSPHGHTDPRWWAEDPAFPDAAALLVQPDHYVVRMLVSQGVPFEALGIGVAADPRAVWRIIAERYHLFIGTPSRLWLDHAFAEVFGIEEDLGPATAEMFFDRIGAALATPPFRPRALHDRFGIEAIATTDAALDDLAPHRAVAASGWDGRVLPTYRPDAVADPDHEGFAAGLDRLAELTGCDTGTWDGYLEAHRARRAVFAAHGATATDHGHPSPQTADLPRAEAAALFGRVRAGRGDANDHELFRAQMLTEMARMSAEDGLVMQLHAGSRRNTSAEVFARYGQDRGFDMPVRADFVTGLEPLLNAVGFAPRFRLVVFTLDEATYARELAPLAGAWPCLRLGPPWWFHDSVEGMLRYRRRVMETAGIWNTAGFNDDTRALLSIPARHDVARRVDCAWLAGMVVTHRLTEMQARDMAVAMAGDLAREAYRL